MLIGCKNMDKINTYIHYIVYCLLELSYIQTNTRNLFSKQLK